MRINGFHIDGFGIFSNQGIQDIPKGLVLFTGKNEGGKTTLMEFIRMVLFGIPKKGVNDYQPLRGGNHGGRLKITMEDGRVFTIERQGKRPSIIRDDGTIEQVEPSSLLLRGIDRLTFERIFAIGLKDLEGLDVLSQEGVRGRLLAASTGVGAASVPIIINQIDGELENLLKSRGKNPKINALAKEIESVNDEIKKLQSQSAEYGELQHNLAQLKEENRLKRLESDSIRQKIAKIEQLKQARAPWVNLLEARNKVIELEFARRFPVNGLERLEKIKDDIESYFKDKKALETRIKSLESQLSRFLESQEFRLKVIEHRNTIKTLVK
ncbi:hypothetical protein FJZ33_10450, partial [Candidatus Poribacteria bacterium]|nr:hypothetical protein [Candidatus Poribacteria bacterium]